ncbi:sigma-70 family RNA polymerase sigma factor [Acetobacter sp. LMG 1636]|uniref:Sigma-70 family RNA polymerase sigma factor n=1 Tax=Acetobacter fallax TaxID=1737473 RepID=A0ABX0K9G1_9PROT|nr:sigma-70 family RNA polymerase sigma factor [Acetobacter fallax]NHO36699.1 sigma-70 family RNA polymerase sigma factor [Acetobacter fallax]
MGEHDQKRACLLSAAADVDRGEAPDDIATAGEARAPSWFRDEIVGLLPELRAFARFLSRDRARADDLVQEAIMRALAARAQFDPATNLKAWVFTILRNLFYEQGRRRKREQIVLEEYSSDAAIGSSPSADSYQLSDLDRMLWQLSPLLREALMLVGAQGMSYEEAAAICGIAVGTMKARVSRARAALVALRDSETGSG